MPSCHRSAVKAPASASICKQRSRSQHFPTCRARFNTVDTKQPEDYYGLLDVQRNASGVPTMLASEEAEIKRHYRAMQRKYHPDIAGEQGREMSSRINIAYDVLMNKETRYKYDNDAKAAGMPAPGFQRAEGLTGPLAERAVPLGEVQFEGIAADAAIDWLQQWGTSITFGCEVPFPSPLQCDALPEGVRFAAIKATEGHITCIGELCLEIDTERLDKENVASVMVTRVSKTPQFPMPGEQALLKTLKNALKFKRNGQKGMQAQGWFGTLLSGSLGLLPLVHFGDQDTGYDSYRIPARCSMSAKPKAPQPTDF